MSKKKSRKILALILSVMLIVSTIPTSVLATDTSTELITEEIALREENVKHFKMPDGSYTAVVYSEPVHRMDSNGEWQDIDNRMKESTVKNKQAYITDDGRAVFSKKVDKTNSTIFELVDNGYSIKVSVVDDNIQNTTAKLSNHAKKYIPTSADDFEEQYKKLKTIDNNTTVSYKNLLKGITFEYVLSSNDVKENIIIDKKFDKYEYTFVYELSGLLALLNDDGSINLIDEITKNFVYTIPAPYMYDAEGEVSYDVSYELEELEKGLYSLTVSADEMWINDSERVFPVVIDPTVTFTAGYYDTYINSADPSANYGSSSELWISSTKTPFMKYNFLPTLPVDATINSAKLNLYYYYNVSTGSLNAGLYLVGVNWNESTWTWNTANQNSSLGILPTRLATLSLPASSSITSSTPGIATISITELVQAWYAGTTNYGIALKYESGTNGSVILKAWESGSATRANYEVSYTTGGLTVSNGTYFFQNGQYHNYMQIDNNASIYDGGAIFELWEFDGESEQKWNFEYMHNGYYKISSYASAKALTSPQNLNDSVTQEVYEASSDQLWKITSAGNNLYKLSPKSHNTYYLAAGDGIFASDGRNVEMRSSQSDQKDEWYIYGAGEHTVNLTVIYDNAYYNRYNSAYSRINNQIQILKEKYLDECGISVVAQSPSLFSCYADINCTTSYTDECNHVATSSCMNSTLSSLQIYHHTNIFNILLRVPHPDVSSCVKVAYIGHEFCVSDEHDNHPFFGVTYPDIGLSAITNFESEEDETRTLIHEFGHFFKVEDHYGRNGKTTEEIIISSGNTGYNRNCIYGENKETSSVTNNYIICDGCKSLIMKNANRYSQ